MSQAKKVVLYNACRGVFPISYLAGETRYVVFPVNHTSSQVTNGQSATTSPVVKPINSAGEFETLNSIYKPMFVPLDFPDEKDIEPLDSHGS